MSNDIEQQANAWLIRMNATALSDQEEQAFIDWLTACPEHQDAFAEAERLWEELGELPALTVEGEAQPAADDKVVPLPGQPSIEEPVTPPKSAKGRWFALAAMIAMLALWLPQWVVMMQADHQSIKGEIERITLDDGSIVILNTDSAIAVHYSSSQRLIKLLKGEAYFEVAKAKQRPFRVAADGGVTTALGTAFNVRVNREETVVTVTEHEVLVQLGQQEQAITQGQQLAYNEQAIDAPKTVDVDGSVAWRKKRLVVDNWPLSRVVQELNRYHRGVIIIRDKQMMNLRVSGSFSLKSPEQALRSISKSLGLEVKSLGNYVVWLESR